MLRKIASALFPTRSRREPDIQCSIKGENNTVRYDQARCEAVNVSIVGNNNEIEIGDHTVLRNVIFFFRGDGHRVKIGRDCRFNKGGTIWMEDHHGVLTIGDRTSFEDVHLAITEPDSKMTIGQDCMFAYDIDVRTGDSHSILDAETGKRINYAKDVVVGNHVWVAAHVIILKGVHVPDDCVVATGAVLTRTFDQKGCILGGNPAKQLKNSITWDRKRIYPT